MEHDDIQNGHGGRGLSTQDLLAAEPSNEAADPSNESAELEEGSIPDSRTSNEEAVPELFTVDEVERFRSDWQAIQTAFVDDPKSAVRDADQLVAAVIQSLAATFADHKSELESQWSQGEAPTEDLRIALRRYRSFFNQLLSN
jgi:hypothetical protein